MADTKVYYSLKYRKQGETITVEGFSSLADAIRYCRIENIDDPSELTRIETRSDTILDRIQMLELLRSQG